MRGTGGVRQRPASCHGTPVACLDDIERWFTSATEHAVWRPRRRRAVRVATLLRAASVRALCPWRAATQGNVSIVPVLGAAGLLAKPSSLAQVRTTTPPPPHPYTRSHCSSRSTVQGRVWWLTLIRGVHPPPPGRGYKPRLVVADRPEHIMGTAHNVARIHEALTEGPRVCCVRGIGGVGKSTTAWECVAPVCAHACGVVLRAQRVVVVPRDGRARSCCAACSVVGIAPAAYGRHLTSNA